MTRTPVASTNLASYGYDADRRVLEVEMRPTRSGEAYVYAYEDVPPEVFARLEAAPSKGSCFHHNIRERFRHAKVAIVIGGDERRLDVA